MTGVTGLLVDGRYRLLEAVGAGAMGRVWRGRDERLDREVAVKEVLLSDDLPSTARERQIARTMREARAAARLRHPGIVTVHDVTLHEGVPWIVMELLPGPSLAALIAHEGRLDRGRVAAFGADVADALAHAHAAGIVHRDLKPDNVLMDGDRAVITDFGIARILDASGPLTSVGVIMGTLQYMAPEQLAGDPVEAPADLWALGATLYAAVEGHPPYPGRTWIEINEALRTSPPPSAPHAGPLGELLAALLAKLPSARPDAATAARLLRATLALHDTGTQGLDATATRTRRQPPREPNVEAALTVAS
ncbi:serine/threonine-protein kinase [Embleya sp. NPDC059259]|uniref:serine/threonine-protein kinase n=1 Tax=unclassified Embleya TaxID=2699296 RepID=UPI00367EABE1